ncbi:hypothetical protein C8Q77DRAFT_1152252 [Trametes polyzona]|nr:hypothetical protein C8Q77DRAFT_1152252 [Trametes polyzona]
MPPPLDRESLKSMKRADLQRICKDYGIKANLKTEALIDLLIDTTQARPRPTPPVPQRAPSGRKASRTASSGSRLRGPSSSSVIIHDTDEEDNAAPEPQRRSVATAASSETEAPPPPPRTRRAKETQYRLGVGRPTVVGGSGARAVTRSSSFNTRGKRAKGSKSVKPTEAAIQEEEEPDPVHSEMPEAGPSGTTHDHEPLPPPPMPEHPQDVVSTPHPPPTDAPEQVKAYVEQLIGPFQAQIKLLQSELQQRSSQEADIRLLTSQLQSIQAEVQTLRAQSAMTSQLQSEVLQLKQLVSNLISSPVKNDPRVSMKSLGKARASDEGSDQATVAGSDSSHNNNASEPSIPATFSQSSLGKRHRESEDSHITDVIEAGQESQYSQGELEKRAVRPTKKKVKLSAENTQGEPQSAIPGEAPLGDEGGAVPASRPPPATFTVFRGPEEPPESYIEPPPPTTHLSDLFPLSSGGIGQTPAAVGGAIPRPAGSDENAPNQFGFNFSFNTSIFHPMTSTPFDMGHPAFPYPEPPGSPTPGNPSGGFVERAGGRIERNDLYHPHGRRQAAEDQSHPPPASSQTPGHAAPSQSGPSQPQSQSQGTPMNGTIDTAALAGTTSGLPSQPSTSHAEASNTSLTNGVGFASQTRRVASSSEIGMAFGMSGTLPLPPETPAPPMKRTMYGTELESDTRFGDFGVEGVATGFWAGLVPRF